MKEREHIYYFDYLRIIAAVSVVYIHTVSGFMQGVICGQWQIANILLGFAYTAVPIFFMISGYLLISSEKTLDIPVLFKKRLPRLVAPAICWTLLASVWYMYLNNTFGGSTFVNMIVGSFANPIAIHFWFIYTLIAFYLISPVLSGGIRALDNKGRIMVFVLCLAPSLKYIIQVFLPTEFDKYVEFDIINKMYLFSGHISSFILGYLLGSIKKKISNYILIPSAVLLWALISFGTYRITVIGNSYNQAFNTQSMGFEIILAGLIFLIFKQNFNKEWIVTKRIPLVPLAMPIYFMHGILLSIMFTIGVPINSVMTIVGATLANFVICFFTMKTIATIKPLCFFVTGISFKEACSTCNWIYTYRWIKEAFMKKSQNKIDVQ